MSKELEYMLLMSVWKMSAEQEKKAIKLFQEGLDWDVFLAEVNQNRVWPLVHYNMKRYEMIESDAFQSIAKRVNQCNYVSMKSTMTLAKVFKVFDEHRIDAMVLKGPTLSQKIYNNVSMRSSKDLDILVREEQLLEAVDVLESIGFCCSAALKTSKRRKCIFNKQIAHDFSLYDGTVEIELHWRTDSIKGLTFDTMFEQKESRILCGVRVDMPNRLANLYYLVFHGVKHGFYRLKWLLDIYELLQREDYLNIQELYHYFTQKKTGYILLATLMILHSLGLMEFHLEADQKELEAAKKLHNAIWSIIIAEDFDTKQTMRAEFTSVFWRELEKRNLKGIMPWYEVLQPDVYDFEVIDLPDSLFFLYYPIRVMYWAWRKTPFYKGGYHANRIGNIMKRY